MFLTTREKNRIIIAIVVVLIIAVAIWYIYLKPSDEKTTAAQKQSSSTTTPKEEPKPLGIASYTQYEKSQNTCIYYYDGGQCYVPLSFCVIDKTVKTPQELDKGKYCSQTANIQAKAIVSPIGSACPFTATEGDLIDLYSIVRDPDQNDPTYPIGPLGRLDITFSAPFKGSKGLWKTEKGDVGIYNFDISVTDGQYTDTEAYCIEVKVGNRPPVLSNLFDLTVVAGDTITLEPKCVDPDNDPVTISYFGDISDREWMTTNTKKTEAKDVGMHTVTVKCADDRGLPAYKSIAITVLKAPVLPPPTIKFTLEPQNKTIKEGETVTLNPKIESDAGKPVAITYSGWMTSATKTASYIDAGLHDVTITATDGITTLKRIVWITVINVNRPPEIVSTQPSP